MHTGRGPRWRREQSDGAGEREIWIAGAQHRAGSRGGVLAQNDGGRTRAGERPLVLWIRQERHVSGTGILDPRDALDVEVAIAVETTLQPQGEVAEFHKMDRESLLPSPIFRRGERSCARRTSPGAAGASGWRYPEFAPP